MTDDAQTLTKIMDFCHARWQEADQQPASSFPTQDMLTGQKMAYNQVLQFARGLTQEKTTMTKASPGGVEDDHKEQSLGPSLAYPPLYVLRTGERCPKCGRAQHVYMLGCAAFDDAGLYEPGDDGRPVDDFHFLRRIRSVPDRVMRLLKARCPGFYFDQEEGDGRHYLMNHCRCRAKLDDDYLHGDVGAAFWPDTPDGFGQLKLFRLPIEEPIPVASSYMLGGGEYLNTDDAEPW